jgi:hypothetical protein
MLLIAAAVLGDLRRLANSSSNWSTTITTTPSSWGMIRLTARTMPRSPSRSCSSNAAGGLMATRNNAASMAS